MTNPSEAEIAEEILKKSGFLEHRAAVVDAVEIELFSIYSELDDGLPSQRSEQPTTYHGTVQTTFDLIANREIHRTLYLQQSRGERAFLRKAAYDEDFYVKVLRGKGNDFSQYWYFNFPLKKNEIGGGWAGYFSFTFRVGVRDTYPYEIKIRDHLGVEALEAFVERIRGY